MQILVHLLIVSSVLGFHKGFHKLILGGVVLVECVSFLKHLALRYELGCGVFLFGIFIEVYRILGLWLFIILGFGLRFFLSRNFCSGLSGKSGNFKVGFCSKSVLGGKSGLSNLIDKIQMEKMENLYSCSDVGGEIDSDSDDELDDEVDAKNNGDDGVDVKANGDDGVYAKNNGDDDITALRELLKIEHEKVNGLKAELVKERAASATAAEEAMAMILRLQSEKSLLEREWSQYRRLSEEKQIHDQHVIKSLQWLVWQHEFKRRHNDNDHSDEEDDWLPILCRQQKAKGEEDGDCFNGNILDALENVLYSSRDSD